MYNDMTPQVDYSAAVIAVMAVAAIVIIVCKTISILNKIRLYGKQKNGKS